MGTSTMDRVITTGGMATEVGTTAGGGITAVTIVAVTATMEDMTTTMGTRTMDS